MSSRLFASHLICLSVLRKIDEMLLLAIGLLGMDENDYGIGNLLFDFLIRSFLKGFGMSFPTKVLRLETQKLHGEVQ